MHNQNAHAHKFPDALTILGAQAFLRMWKKDCRRITNVGWILGDGYTNRHVLLFRDLVEIFAHMLSYSLS